MVDAFRALLFDLDGTLIDSMPLHHEAWRAWFARRAMRFDEDGFFEATAGRTNEEILRELLPELPDSTRSVLAEEKEALYRGLASQSLGLIAGAQAVLESARRAGLRLAICTAAPPANIAIALRRFGFDRFIGTITSPADGLRGKPNPDIFLEAARRLGVAAGECLVFEDAPLGVEAARRAGMAAVALTTTLPAPAFAGFANLRHTMADFVGFDPASLTREEKNHA